MNPPMYKRVKDVFESAQLTDGYKTQCLFWADDGAAKKGVMVFRPNGGTNIDRDIGSEHYVLVDIVSPKGGAAEAEQDVLAIIDFVQQNPLISSCLGQITNMGGIPPPVMTTEGRIVWRLQFACLYGEN